MPAVVGVGGRAILDGKGTDDEFLASFVGLFAELDDGRVVEVDPSHLRTSGPRRGLGAVWVRFDGVLHGGLRSSGRRMEASTPRSRTG